MVKTMKVEGEALAVVREMQAHGERVDADVRAIHEAAQRQHDVLMARLKGLLGLEEGDHCHVDVEYLAEHGLAFAKTGCGGGLLSQLLAGMGGGAASKPGVH